MHFSVFDMLSAVTGGECTEFDSCRANVAQTERAGIFPTSATVPVAEYLSLATMPKEARTQVLLQNPDPGGFRGFDRVGRDWCPWHGNMHFCWDGSHSSCLLCTQSSPLPPIQYMALGVGRSMSQYKAGYNSAAPGPSGP